MSALNLFSCPLCGESIEIPDLDFEGDVHPLSCPVCGTFVNDYEAVVAMSVPVGEPRPGRVKR
jgi:transcription elongation factor Elf1